MKMRFYDHNYTPFMSILSRLSHRRCELLSLGAALAAIDVNLAVKPWFQVKIKINLKNIISEPPPSVDRPIFLFQARFHHEMK